jgi:hypothetical protein
MLSSDILERIKEFVFDRDDFYIISHYDTDGICSLFIFKNILDNLGKNYKFDIIKGLDDKVLELNPGDSAYYSSTMPHLIGAKYDEALIIAVMYSGE